MKIQIESAVGKKFCRLLVLSAFRDAKSQVILFCRCDCGTEKEFAARHVFAGASKSCGCLNRELASKRETVHGESSGGGIRKSSPEYNSWCAMIDRCCNEHCHAFKDYGGRGISVCDDWRNSFESFLSDMGRRPTLKHSLDRWPDKDGNYAPSNCRWATRIEQANNKRNNHILTFLNKSQSVANWAREMGRSEFTLHTRIKAGWSVERILEK